MASATSNTAPTKFPMKRVKTGKKRTNQGGHERVEEWLRRGYEGVLGAQRVSSKQP